MSSFQFTRKLNSKKRLKNNDGTLGTWRQQNSKNFPTLFKKIIVQFSNENYSGVSGTGFQH